MHGLCVTSRARGVEFAAPRQVRIGEVVLPRVGSGDAVVRTRCSGFSSGTELLAYRGGIDPALPLDASIGALGGTFTYPFRYGYSCVGVVEQGPPDLTPGSLVFAFHPHQDVFVIPAAALVELGDVEPRAATFFPMVETALQITVEAAALTGRAVVIIGLGLVGLLTSLLVRRETAVVLGVDPLGWRRDVAQRLGIAAVAPDEVVHALDERGLDGVPLVI